MGRLLFGTLLLLHLIINRASPLGWCSLKISADYNFFYLSPSLCCRCSLKYDNCWFLFQFLFFGFVFCQLLILFKLKKKKNLLMIFLLILLLLFMFDLSLLLFLDFNLKIAPFEFLRNVIWIGRKPDFVFVVARGLH